MRRAFALVVVAVAFAGCEQGSGDEVTRYCKYGAVSKAQLDGCESHVTTDDIDARDTNAARYARGELTDCLADAGPFCRQ